MKSPLVLLSLMAGLGISAALAQTGQTPQDRLPGNPAVKDPTVNSNQQGSAGAGAGSAGAAASLEAGANSFTESQARSRIEGAGFGNVTGLTKDDQGIWRGKAERGGQPVNVGLDYKGNVTGQ